DYFEKDFEYNTDLPSIKEAVEATDTTAAIPAITWNYGAFIQQCVDFTILAFCVFLMVKGMNKLMNMKKKEEAAAPAPAPEPPKPTLDQELLTEIRDLLKEKK
ncbi:MAG: MscL family protein, partial [Alistipes sp.]|nr:MscL family protein [Alistipes sp.]